MKIIETKYLYFKVTRVRGNMSYVINTYNDEKVAQDLARMLAKIEFNNIDTATNKYIVEPSNSLI